MRHVPNEPNPERLTLMEVVRALQDASDSDAEAISALLDLLIRGVIALDPDVAQAS